MNICDFCLKDCKKEADSHLGDMVACSKYTPKSGKRIIRVININTEES